MDISVTLLLIIVTVGTSLYAWNRPDVMDKWIMNPYRVQRRGEWLRFLTSGFIHKDYTHLIFNMIAWYGFGEIVEIFFVRKYGVLGLGLYALVYLAAIVVSEIPTYLKHRNHPYYNSLGASGGVSAIVFAAILFYPLGQIGIIFLPFFRLPAFIFGGLYMLYTWYMSRRGGDMINHDAHLYGALFGIACSALLIPEALPLFVEQVRTWRLNL